jgi:cephalosporin hydroxylase
VSQFAVAGRTYNIDERSLTRPGREADRQQLIDDYHRLWYDESVRGLTWGNMTYFGYKLWKMPSDLFLYQHLIHLIRPALLIETGTAFGGSALYYAHLMDQIGIGRVLSIDLNEPSKTYPRHPRIEYFGGKSSTDDHIVRDVAKRVKWYGGPIIVSLDSSHAMEHVFGELNRYAPFVTPSSYLVVEDTNVNGHPVFPSHGPGPQEALDKWLPRHPDFVPDERLRATMLFSMHTWLRRERG